MAAVTLQRQRVVRPGDASSARSQVVLVLTLGEPVPYVMAEAGHTSPADAGDLPPRHASPRKASVSGSAPSSMAGHPRRFRHVSAQKRRPGRDMTLEAARPTTTKLPRMPGLLMMGAAGFEPATSRV